MCDGDESIPAEQREEEDGRGGGGGGGGGGEPLCSIGAGCCDPGRAAGVALHTLHTALLGRLHTAPGRCWGQSKAPQPAVCCVVKVMLHHWFISMHCTHNH